MQLVRDMDLPGACGWLSGQVTRRAPQQHGDCIVLLKFSAKKGPALSDVAVFKNFGAPVW